MNVSEYAASSQRTPQSTNYATFFLLRQTFCGEDSRQEQLRRLHAHEYTCLSPTDPLAGLSRFVVSGCTDAAAELVCHVVCHMVGLALNTGTTGRIYQQEPCKAQP